MKFDHLVEITADLHCFSAATLSAGENLNLLRVQLNQWVKSGRVIRIHKGCYTLASPYRRLSPDMNVIASAIRPGTYISLQSALAIHGMIPEYVPETTCIGTGRPLLLETPLGRLSYRHIKPGLFWGYEEIRAGSQSSFVARPEKALLDLIYLTPGSADLNYIVELRLQNLEEMDMDLLDEMIERYAAPRLKRLPGLLAELRAATDMEPME